MSAKSPTKEEKYLLRLYVVSDTPQSARAYRNLQTLCREHLAGRYRLDVIDLTKNPALAKADGILAVPTLVRKMPVPIRKFIGSLTDTARVLVEFDLVPNATLPPSTGKVAANVT
jgi:circadian clock protein KaiB